MEINSSSFGLSPAAAAQICSILANSMSGSGNTGAKENSTRKITNSANTTSLQNAQLLETLQALIAESCKSTGVASGQVQTATNNINQSAVSAAANTTTSPLGLEAFKYGSNSNNNPHLIVPPATDQPYILAAIGTPPAAGELYMARTANLFNDTWKSEVKSAIEKNGGLGTEADGFLAFSKIGFVRLNNTNLTAEQNRKLAAISIQLGIPVEDLPSRSKSSVSKPEINSWVEDFLKENDTKLNAFLENPATGYSIKDGRHLYQMAVDTKSGLVTSSHERLHGGIRGWCAKNMKWLSPALDVVSKVTSLIPGWGTIASVVTSGLKAAGNMISAGKFKTSELWGFVSDAATSCKLPIGKWGNQAVEWLVQKTGLDAKALKETVKTCFKIDVDDILSKMTKIEEESTKEKKPGTENQQESNVIGELKKPIEEIMSAFN